ncbi:hypothetical protein [Natrinema salifodinae]|uniref:DUF8108 domain-containing protein n=1 Tax=Natrinema salifodinae TaxID=1202768 RepID=A0A1I0NMP3_9EURY|nr:hypothetical protein [Natrinema salifodinae]SEW02145.1 hypothetical protein SAMN05216285_1863 [Natrinema salifodinae]
MTRPDRRPNAARGLRRLADHVGFALLWCWILVSLFFVPTWLGYWWVGALLFVVGLVVCWQAAGATTDPVYTVGTKREVRTGRVESERVDCDECGRPAAGGEYRRYERRRVLFGTTVSIPELGENVYCQRCAYDPRDPDLIAGEEAATGALESERLGVGPSAPETDGRSALESERR